MEVVPHDIKQSDSLSLYKKNELDMGTVIDAAVGSADCLSHEWGL